MTATDTRSLTQGITLTPAAEAHVLHLIQTQGKGVGLKLGVKSAGCSGLAYTKAIVDVVHPMDLCFPQVNGLQVYVSPEHFNPIKGLIVDYVQEGIGQHRWVFTNPNESGSCGCGESFSTE